MAMRWRVTAEEWQPNQHRLLNRDGCHRVDEEEGRRRLSAYELNSMIGLRAAIFLLDMLMPDLERQARHVGDWPRLRAAFASIRNISHDMLNKVSLEQLISLKNNTQKLKIAVTPEMSMEPEMMIQPWKEQNRLLCASLAYCQYHCDGSQQCQRGCKIKKLMEQSCYIQDCDFPELVPGQCKYSMADVDWEPIRKE